MRMRLLRWIGVLLGCLLATAPACAQDGGGRVEAVWTAYQQLEYGRADSLARSVLAAYADYTPAQLAEVHTVLGLMAYADGAEGEARRQFEAALSLDPGLELDPLLVSPKILAFVDDVRAQQAQRPSRPAGDAEAARYVVQPDPRPPAAMRSMLVPGWGQLYKGESRKGWALVGAWGVAAGGAVTAHVLRGRAEEAYLDEDDPARVADRYDRFNTWHRVRNNAALAAAGVWLVAYVDALVRPVQPRALHGALHGALHRVSVRPQPGAVQVQMTWRW